MNDKQIFDKDYFIDSEISNYQNYLNKKYEGLTNDLITHFEMKPSDIIIDFGCGTGAVVFEFVKRGYIFIRGTDISHWAIETGRQLFKLNDEIVHYNRNLLEGKKEYVLCLDVLEHLPEYEIDLVLQLAKKDLYKSFIMRVPVSIKEGKTYFFECSRVDKTHLQCWTREKWIQKMIEHKYTYVEDLHLKHIYSSEGVFCGVFKTNNKKND